MPRENLSINELVGPHDLLDPHWWEIQEIQEWIKDHVEPETRGFTPDFTEGDRVMLRSAAHALRTARTNVNSSNKQESAEGRGQLIAITNYLRGFFDGKRVVAVPPGLLSIALSKEQDGSMEGKLDALQKSLEEVSTRGPGLFAIEMGIGIYVAACALDAIATALEQ